ncbi:MAG: hypothetical protein ABSB94_15735 [Syntrophorhabdales bacterium]|jgi:hypothetical protein
MSENRQVAKKVAGILRMLAKKVEDDPGLVSGLKLDQIEMSAIQPKKRVVEVTIDFDVVQVVAEAGESVLRQRLETLDLQTLKGIVRQHGFDASKLAEKWRRKERLIDLIIERASARSDKGKVFEEYS